MLTKIYIKNFICLPGHGLQKSVQRCTSYHIPLSQRPKTNTTSLTSQSIKFRSIRHVIPRHALFYFVTRNSLSIQRNFNFIINDSTALSDAAQAFVDWATSTEASDLIAGAGAVPVAE